MLTDKPNRPNGPIEVTEIRAEKATVKWQKPDDWKGSDITGYTLEKMDMVRIRHFSININKFIEM